MFSTNDTSSEDCQVTVLMPAYNAAKTIETAIRSLIHQTFRNWQLLVINDGSTDDTQLIADRLAAEDQRIRVLNEPHRGFCETLNYGLRTITTRYVARLDADDVSYPTRLAMQMAYLQEHPEVKILGTYGDRINDTGRRLSSMDVGLTTIEECRRAASDGQVIYFIHSSVVADRATLLHYGGYRPENYPAEDVWLWSAVAQEHPVCTLPERLVAYRISRGVSNQNLKRQMLQDRRLAYCLKTKRHVDLATYCRMLDSDIWQKAVFLKSYLHRYAFRSGSYFFFNHRLVLGAVFLLGAAALEPMTVVRRAVYQK